MLTNEFSLWRSLEQTVSSRIYCPHKETPNTVSDPVPTHKSCHTSILATLYHIYVFCTSIYTVKGWHSSRDFFVVIKFLPVISNSQNYYFPWLILYSPVCLCNWKCLSHSTSVLPAFPLLGIHDDQVVVCVCICSWQNTCILDTVFVSLPNLYVVQLISCHRLR